MLRRLAFQIQQAASQLGDATATGASVVLTVDNAPANGVASVAITAGPITTGTFFA